MSEPYAFAETIEERALRAREYSESAARGEFAGVFAALDRRLEFTVANRSPARPVKKPVPPPGDRRNFGPVILEALRAEVGWANCGYRTASAGVSNTETAVLLAVTVDDLIVVDCRNCFWTSPTPGGAWLELSPWKVRRGTPVPASVRADLRAWSFAYPWRVAIEVQSAERIATALMAVAP